MRGPERTAPLVLPPSDDEMYIILFVLLDTEPQTFNEFLY